MFNVDFRKIVLWLTPVWMRKPNVMILALAFNWPLRQVYNWFLIYSRLKLYRLAHNSQVCYLQKVLNDAFDLTQKRIYISDFDGVERIYFWREIDLLDIDFSITQYFWADADYADSGIDFTVHLPVDIVTTETQMAYLRSLVDEYKLAGKNYNVVRI